MLFRSAGVAPAPQKGELVVVESAGNIAVDARKFIVAICVARSVARPGVAPAPQKGELVVVESA